MSKEFKFYQSIFNNTLFTTKKLGLSQCFKTAGIALKNLGIGQKHLFWCFFSWRFLPLRNECGNRSAWPTPTLFQTTGIGPSGFENLFRRFFFFLLGHFSSAVSRPILALFQNENRWYRCIYNNGFKIAPTRYKRK